MQVGGRSAWVNNGVQTESVEDTRAFHTPEGVGAKGKAQRKGDGLLHGE